MKANPFMIFVASLLTIWLLIPYKLELQHFIVIVLTAICWSLVPKKARR